MLENYHKKELPFTFVSAMPLMHHKCFIPICTNEVVQAVDWNPQKEYFPPRQLVACTDCIAGFMEKQLPGVSDSGHRKPEGYNG